MHGFASSYVLMCGLVLFPTKDKIGNLSIDAERGLCGHAKRISCVEDGGVDDSPAAIVRRQTLHAKGGDARVRDHHFAI